MDDRESVIEYLSEFSLYKKITIGGQKYILTHIGLPDSATYDNLHSFDAYDFAGPDINTDYNKVYFEDIILVTGHLPTFIIDETCRGRVYRKHNHIAIDTGAVFGETLSCVCLDTDEEFYVYRNDSKISANFEQGWS
jgi:serine/threonine protein phosphatase 1